MNECGVCGILYLAGGSCPACGSQIQKRSEDFQDAEMVLPTEVPGLDEAAEAWYELEGMQPPEEDVKTNLPLHSRSALEASHSPMFHVFHLGLAAIEMESHLMLRHPFLFSKSRPLPQPNPSLRLMK